MLTESPIIANGGYSTKHAYLRLLFTSRFCYSVVVIILFIASLNFEASLCKKKAEVKLTVPLDFVSVPIIMWRLSVN